MNDQVWGKKKRSRGHNGGVVFFFRGDEKIKNVTILKTLGGYIYVRNTVCDLELSVD